MHVNCASESDTVLLGMVPCTLHAAVLGSDASDPVQIRTQVRVVFAIAVFFNDNTLKMKHSLFFIQTQCKILV